MCTNEYKNWIGGNDRSITLSIWGRKERIGEVDGVAKNGVNESHVQRQQGEGEPNEVIKFFATILGHNETTLIR